MKNWIKKWLNITGIWNALTYNIATLNNINKRVESLENSLQNRRQEIDGLIESFQNLDNNEVIRDLHLRIEKLENDKGIK